MAAQPDLEVQTEFETSGILAGRVGNRDIDSARRIDNGNALPCPQEREQVVDERRVAEMDVHVAAVMELPTPRTLSECGRVRPSLQDHEGPPIFSKESGGRADYPATAVGEILERTRVSQGLPRVRQDHAARWFMYSGRGTPKSGV
jgi:hypothetical protein